MDDILLQLLKDYGPGASLILFGSFVIKAMWDADKIVRPESRAEFGASSLSFWAYEIRNFDFFKDIYDRLYKTQRLYRPSITRFVVLGPVIFGVFYIAYLMWWQTEHEMSWYERQTNYYTDQIIPNSIMTSIIVNLLFDYFSVWYSRFIINFIDRSFFAMPLLLVIDFSGSLLIFFLGWGLSGVFEDLIFAGDSHNIVESFIYGVKEPAEVLGTAAVSFTNKVGVGTAFAVLLVSVLCTTITSIWLWTYTATLLLSGLLRYLTWPIRIVAPHLNFDGTPMRANGVLMGSMFIAAGLIEGGWLRLAPLLR